MLFNSFAYIVFFLPIIALLYNVIKKINISSSKVLMILSSLYFYTYLTDKYVVLLIASCAITYSFSVCISKNINRKLSLLIGIVINVFILAYFKYISFFISAFELHSYQYLSSWGLPLAISFFTFQQISFLVDKYNGKIQHESILDYLFYITFFPKLISGPITRFNDLYPQTNEKRVVKSFEFLAGLSIISIGLFKKVVLSSFFAGYADSGYASTHSLTFFDAWGTSLAYTMQIYFDFSGYSDVAIGSALLLGLRLPINFNSPYKALNIRDFWDRWHISLSTWLRDYIYIPLGGGRVGEVRAYLNVMATFIVSGIWHGVGVNFLMWGIMHGVATCISRAWTKAGFVMNKYLAWFITFNFINLSWIPFRANDFDQVKHIVTAMLGMNGINYSAEFIKNIVYFTGLSWLQPLELSASKSIVISSSIIPMLAISLFIVFKLKNSNELSKYSNHRDASYDTSYAVVVLSAIALFISIISMFGGTTASNFIYASF